MATLDLSKSRHAVDMTDPNLVGFASADLTFPGNWSFFSPTGNYVHLTGSDMTFDAQGHALSGAVDSVTIDIGNDDIFNPDIRLTGIGADAPIFDDGPAGFWRVLEGNDTIIGPAKALIAPNVLSRIVGDGIAARAGTSAGGNDLISFGDTEGLAYGDVVTVGSSNPGAQAVNFRGGADEIIGYETDRNQSFYGDANFVYASGRLIGGNDRLVVQSTNYPAAIGDAGTVEGIATDIAEVYGGDDILVASGSNYAILIGDVGQQRAYSFVRGGNDTFDGSEQQDYITGDVGNTGSSGVSTVGGADTIYGNGGDDVIVGDVYNHLSNSKLVAGKDTIYGGGGADRIHGDIANGTLGNMTGGADRLYGETGDDFIEGQVGNDLLDGGAGADRLDGGDGFDLASYAKALQGVKAALDGSFAGTGDAFGDRFTAIEALEGSAYADTLRGDAGANKLFGNAGKDNLQGADGSDTIIGGLGADTLSGGAGSDRFDFLTLADRGDRIADFSNAAGNDDMLRFDGGGFGGLPAGALAAKHFVANTSGVAATLDQHFIYETDTGILRYDANGSTAGGVFVIATLTGAPALTAADFFIF